jgi:8-oxo-dGTP pyrophosphatase MutT (NUDIX family)
MKIIAGNKVIATDGDKDTYFVAVKALLRKGDELLIIKDKFGDWDLPGGRIKKYEFNAKLEDVLQRKIKEELGSKIQYSIGEPKAFYRVERIEALTNQLVHIFGVGFEVQYLDGPIKLSDLFEEYQWVNIKSFEPTKLQNNGWMRGLSEYLRKLR